VVTLSVEGIEGADDRPGMAAQHLCWTPDRYAKALRQLVDTAIRTGDRGGRASAIRP
jgi:hypothetical protein